MIRIHSRKGFTLLELVIVVVIIGIVVAIGLPSFNKAFLRTELNAAIRELTQTLVYAHQCAVSEGISYKVNFSLKNQSYWLSSEDKSQKRLKSKTFGRDITLTKVVIPDQQSIDGNKKYITFKPDGTVDECLLYLQDKRGNIYTVATVKTTGQIKTFNYEYKKK